ncbi:MAG TPA: hypothetical protein VK851_07170 [Anaerolineales bacterium]|nr:hypothetical protein [Anaerolineales bacterium]
MTIIGPGTAGIDTTAQFHKNKENFMAPLFTGKLCEIIIVKERIQ